MVSSREATGVVLDQGPARPSASLRRNWNFQALWTSEAFAAVAKESAEVAYPLLILATTGSAFDAGAVGSAQLLTASFMAIPGGILADRIGRRFLLMSCDLIRAVLLGLFAVLILTGHAGLPVIFAISVLSAVCLGVSNPTGLAVVKQLVRPDQVKQATAQNQIRFFGATMVGPPIGGSLFGVAQSLPFFGAAASFFIGAVLTQLIRTPMKVVTGAKGFSWSATWEGFRFLVRQPILRLMMIWIIGSNMAFTHSSVFLAIVATAKSRGEPPSADRRRAGGGRLRRDRRRARRRLGAQAGAAGPDLHLRGLGRSGRRDRAGDRARRRTARDHRRLRVRPRADRQRAVPRLHRQDGAGRAAGPGARRGDVHVHDRHADRSVLRRPHLQRGRAGLGVHRHRRRRRARGAAHVEPPHPHAARSGRHRGGDRMTAEPAASSPQPLPPEYFTEPPADPHAAERVRCGPPVRCTRSTTRRAARRTW